MLTMSLARELAPQIRVNGVSPGAILWPEREMPDSIKDAILDRTALKRLGEPDDIAAAVAYLALDVRQRGFQQVVQQVDCLGRLPTLHQ